MTHAITPEKVLGTAVATAGTFTLDYPENHSVDDFTLDSPRHVLGVGASAGSKKFYTSSDDFSLAFGATEITVTWKNAATIPAQSVAQAQLDKPGANDDASQELVLPAQVRRVHVVELDLGKPDTSDDDYFVASEATMAAGAKTLLQTVLDVPRNIILTTDGNDTTKTVLVKGRDEYGVEVWETIAFGNNGITAGKKAFKSITSMTVSAQLAGAGKIGFGDVLGLPIWVPSAAHFLGDYEDGGAITDGTLVAGLARATQSTGTTADVRGTYDPNSACNGAKHFKVLVAVDDPTYKGNTQYNG